MLELRRVDRACSAFVRIVHSHCNAIDLVAHLEEEEKVFVWWHHKKLQARSQVHLHLAD